MSEHPEQYDGTRLTEQEIREAFCVTYGDDAEEFMYIQNFGRDAVKVREQVMAAVKRAAAPSPSGERGEPEVEAVLRQILDANNAYDPNDLETGDYRERHRLYVNRLRGVLRAALRSARPAEESQEETLALADLFDREAPALSDLDSRSAHVRMANALILAGYRRLAGSARPEEEREETT